MHKGEGEVVNIFQHMNLISTNGDGNFQLSYLK